MSGSLSIACALCAAQLWLFALVALPARSGLPLRAALCALLICITLCSLPKETSSVSSPAPQVSSLMSFFSFSRNETQHHSCMPLQCMLLRPGATAPALFASVPATPPHPCCSPPCAGTPETCTECLSEEGKSSACSPHATTTPPCCYSPLGALPPSVPKLQRQLLQAAALSALLFLGLAFGSDGIRTAVQARDVPVSVEPIPALQLPLPGASGGGAQGGALRFLSSLGFPWKYQYVLLSLGPFQLTRRAVRLGAMAATLSFIVSNPHKPPPRALA